MLDAAIIWNVATEPPTLAILLVTAVLAWPLGRRGGVPGVLFVLALGAVLAATTTQDMPYFSIGGVLGYLHEFHDPRHLFQGFGGTWERLANIGLFVPLGLLGALLWRRPVVVLAGCCALTFAIEGWQGFIGRTADAVDVAHNAAGALIGVVVGTVWTRSAARWRVRGGAINASMAD